MIWWVPANNKSSTWKTSDTRFAEWVDKQSVKHVRHEPDAGVSVRSSGREDLSVVSRSLFLSSDPVFLAHPVTVLHMCVEEGGFHVSCEHCVPFVSEACCLRE